MKDERQELFHQEPLIELINTNSNVKNIDVYFDVIIDEKDIFSEITNRNIEFHNCCFNGSVILSNIVLLERVPIIFHNCSFKIKVILTNISCIQVDFRLCSFELDTFVANSEIETLNFTNCTVKSYLAFDRIKASYICLNENIIHNAKFWEIKADRFQINSLMQNKISRIDFGDNPDLKFLDINSHNNIDIIYLDNIGTARLIGDYKVVTIFGELFKVISIGNKSDVLSNIESLTYTNRIFEGQLILQNSKIKKLDFKDLTCVNGNVRFNNIEICTTSLNNVIISNFYLNQVIFKKELIIKASDLSGLKPNNVTWLKNRILTPDTVFDKKQKDLLEIKYQRDTFRQIKSAYKSTNNKIEELAFYRNEMLLYWKEFKLTKTETKENRILIWINKWVSDFGQSYLRPLCLLLKIHFIFCLVIWNIEVYNHCGINTNCSNDFLKGLKEFFLWLNPVFTLPKHWTDLSIFISCFMRFINGFFIYHFIKATRKFS
ncbi:MAG: hypothetical protein HYU67_07560 [Flavobacteriia bacterium]|nr:hypothetical protein [Flavobacteriia bacterium]